MLSDSFLSCLFTIRFLNMCVFSCISILNVYLLLSQRMHTVGLAFLMCNTFLWLHFLLFNPNEEVPFSQNAVSLWRTLWLTPGCSLSDAWVSGSQTLQPDPWMWTNRASASLQVCESEAVLQVFSTPEFVAFYLFTFPLQCPYQLCCIKQTFWDTESEGSRACE